MTQKQIIRAASRGQMVLSIALLILQIAGLIKGRQGGVNAGSAAAS